MMDMHSRNQYLQVFREEYHKASKKGKSILLKEAEKRTGLHRKYIIRKLSFRNSFEEHPRRKRKEEYDGLVKDALVKIWEIFDFPCGQRLKPLLETEVNRLRIMGSLHCSDDVSFKLAAMGSATIDRKLQHERKVRHLSRHRSAPVHPLLYHKIPVKLPNEWDRKKLGNLQLDFVAHGGSSASGLYIHTLSAADISSGWWEGEAILNRTQRLTHEGLQSIRKRLPFPLQEIHPDNDSAMINHLIYGYCQAENIRFSRSRPYEKNDNAWVEQKNWTHVRKVVGYLRYDTPAQLKALNDLYRLSSLYKNFFQPSMKLIEKERIGSRLKRKYDHPQTPFQRIMATQQVNEKQKKKLLRLYHSLNPAFLRKEIEQKQNHLYHLYQHKMKSFNFKPLKKQIPRLVTSFMIHQNPVLVT